MRAALFGTILLASPAVSPFPAEAGPDPGSGAATSTGSDEDSGLETIPGGGFSAIRPEWRPLHPGEGLQLALVPEGWHVDHLGDRSLMPEPGLDPESGDPCMVFLYDAGRMDLNSEPFLLDGEGRYILSMRTRSVVAPSPRVLRAQLRLLPDDPAAQGLPVVIDRWIGAGPVERVWATHAFTIDVPPGYGRAEIHLIKEEKLSDFLLDDVSLRRLEAEGPRPDPYAGMRAWGGDPLVHTGLGIYAILDAESPLATGSPESAFASARVNRLDWAAVTDYSSQIDTPRARRRREADGPPLVNPDGSTTLSEWEHLKAVVRRENSPGSFLAFLGVTWDGDGFASKGGSGRKAILLPRDDVPAFCSPRVDNVGDCPSVRDAYRYARLYGGVMMAVAPCPAAGRETTDWERYDPEAAPLMDLSGGRCETGEGSLVDVNLHRGLSVGAGGGSGSRSGTAGLHDRTICWAGELTREAIIGAMRERRCYWSAAGHLDLRFSVDGQAMGTTAVAAGPTRWMASATSKDALEFDRIEILRNGVVVDGASCSDVKHCFILGAAEAPEPGLYHAAITARDGSRAAISSPVVLRANGPR